MADVFLVNNNQLSPTDYDWIMAFNNPEFIEYVMTGIAIKDPYRDNINEFIESYKFYSDNKFKSIVHSAYFNSCYKYIGSHAFESCYNLETVHLLSNKYDIDISNYSIIYEIGERAFADCGSLALFSCSTIKKIASQAFLNCSKLTTIFFSSINYSGYYSSQIFDIGNEAFKNCSRLITVSNMSRINRIGNRAFENCTGLGGNYGIGDSTCYQIDNYAFNNCRGFTDLTFNYNITYDYANYKSSMQLRLGRSVFNNCSDIRTLTLYGVKEILSTTFGDGVSNNLTTISNPLSGYSNTNDIHNMLTNIGSRAFEGYSKLQDVRIVGIDTIDEYAFKDCSMFQNVNGSLGFGACTIVKNYAFENCIAMSSILLNAGDWNQSSTYVDVPLSLYGSNIFDGCTSLSLIQLYKCFYIPSELFYNKSIPLTELDFGISVPVRYYFGYKYSATIGEKAFMNCSDLVSCSNPIMNVIGSYAFANCSNLISAPGSWVCHEIKEYAFYNCYNLSGSLGPGYPENYLYFNMGNNTSVIGAGYDSIIIGSHAFDGCSKISTMYVRNVMSIGEYAFKGCTSLISFVDTAPMSNINGCYIGAHAFESASLLNTFTIPQPNYIDDYAFANCVLLSNIVGNRYIGAHAFENCTSLSGLYGPPFASFIGEYAFYNCSNLKWFPFTTGSTSYIASHAFENCIGLSNIVLFYNETIDEYAFKNCTSLSAIAIAYNSSYAESIPKLININAFDGIVSDYVITIQSSQYEYMINDSIWALLSDHFSVYE